MQATKLSGTTVMNYTFNSSCGYIIIRNNFAIFYIQNLNAMICPVYNFAFYDLFFGILIGDEATTLLLPHLQV